MLQQDESTDDGPGGSSAWARLCQPSDREPGSSQTEASLEARAPSRFPRLVPLLLIALLTACGDDTAGTAEDPDAGDAEELDLNVAFDVSDADAGDDPDVGTPDVGGEPDVVDLVDGDTSDAPDASEQPDPGLIDGAVEVELTPSAVPLDEERFSLGVQAGAMRPDGALLWTYAEDRATAQLLVWRPGPRLSSIWQVVDERATPSDGGYFHVPVGDLAPFTEYHFAFFSVATDGSLTARSRIGRFTTAPEPGHAPVLTVGATSCTSQRFQPWRVLERLSQQPLDLFVHLGDMSYNDAADTLEEYRELWGDTLSDEGYLSLYASTGLYATWDDHEVTNDWNPETIDPDRLAAARQAYFETLAVEQGPNGELWRSYRWGDTAEFFVLDSRSERLPSTRNDDDAQYLGPEQMAWLKEGLRDSPAHFRVILNSVPITNMPWLWDVANSDRWEGYEAARDDLLDFIVDEAIPNVWFIGGDFHVGFVAHVEPDGDAHDIYEIAVGPSGNGPNPLSYTLLNDAQFPFATTELDLVQVLTLDPEDDSVRVQVIQDGGAVLWDEVLRQGS